jgi:hypothetical protein
MARPDPLAGISPNKQIAAMRPIASRFDVRFTPKSGHCRPQLRNDERLFSCAQF